MGQLLSSAEHEGQQAPKYLRMRYRIDFGA
jgi:hypothetical protein